MKLRALLLMSVILLQTSVSAQRAAQVAVLKIVVGEGEGAVNIIQQKTAVAPVIEARDRNDQPVAGAVVRFAIQKGRASFNGARTLTATTNALGRATATGLTPIGNSPLQIGASAAFQGQTAAITIAQTNVLTAAQASAAAGGGGGLSHLTVAAITGGAGAGIAGALLASNKSSGSITSKTFAGPFSGQNIVTLSNGAITGTLNFSEAFSGPNTSGGTTTGSGSTSFTLTLR